MDIDQEQSLVFSGSEGEVKAWRIDHGALAGGLKENDTGEART